jgi:hypothetical protein
MLTKGKHSGFAGVPPILSWRQTRAAGVPSQARTECEKALVSKLMVPDYPAPGVHGRAKSKRVAHVVPGLT